MFADIVLSAVKALPQAYDAYTAIAAAIKQWQGADRDLMKLSIRFDIAYAEASYNLDQLANVPSISDVAITAREREVEVRQKCIEVVESQMLECALQINKLLDQGKREMSVKEKAAWFLSAKESLTLAVDELEKWNGYASGVCKLKVSYLYNPKAHIILTLPPPSLPIDALVEISLARARAVASSSIAGSIWIDPSLLTFDDSDTDNAKSKDVLSLKKLWSKLRRGEHADLKFLLRRFGVMNQSEGSAPEQVMVEFRPYAKNLRREKLGEYTREKNQALELGWMLHSASSSNSNATLPLVPFKGVSELANAEPPCFLLVYSGDNLETLFSVIKSRARDHVPPPRATARLQLALTLAKAMFSLHRTGYVHGGLTTDNIFLRLDRPPDTLEPLMSGFEIARPQSAHTSKLDIDDKDHILYLHPSRLPGGLSKDSNYPPYDVCSLGVVLLEIGLWTPLRHLKGMSKFSDDARRENVYKASDKLHGKMGLVYQNVVKYCLAGYIQGASAPAGDVGAEVRERGFGSPNAAEVIARLEDFLSDANL